MEERGVALCVGCQAKPRKAAGEARRSPPPLPTPPQVAARFVEPVQAHLAALTGHRKYKQLAWERARVRGRAHVCAPARCMPARRALEPAKQGGPCLHAGGAARRHVATCGLAPSRLHHAATTPGLPSASLQEDLQKEKASKPPNMAVYAVGPEATKVRWAGRWWCEGCVCGRAGTPVLQPPGGPPDPRAPTRTPGYTAAACAECRRSTGARRGCRAACSGWATWWPRGRTTRPSWSAPTASTSARRWGRGAGCRLTVLQARLGAAGLALVAGDGRSLRQAGPSPVLTVCPPCPACPQVYPSLDAMLKSWQRSPRAPAPAAPQPPQPPRQPAPEQAPRAPAYDQQQGVPAGMMAGPGAPVPPQGQPGWQQGPPAYAYAQQQQQQQQPPLPPYGAPGGPPGGYGPGPGPQQGYWGGGPQQQPPMPGGPPAPGGYGPPGGFPPQPGFPPQQQFMGQPPPQGRWGPPPPGAAPYGRR